MWDELLAVPFMVSRSTGAAPEEGVQAGPARLSGALPLQHTGMYALVSKGMRRIAEGRDPLEGQKHRCGMGNMFDYHSTGYDDLDELQRTPQPLIFIMELFRVRGDHGDGCQPGESRGSQLRTRCLCRWRSPRRTSATPGP